MRARRHIGALDLALKKSARKMSSNDKDWHIETIAGNLAHKLRALASLCHNCTKLSDISQDDLVGIAYMLDELARDAEDCVTIIRPGIDKEASDDE